MLKSVIRNLDCMDVVILVEGVISAGLLMYGIYLCWHLSKTAAA